MTSSYFENKISDLMSRFRAENGAVNDETRSEDNPFSASRLGSGRRPNHLGPVTPTRVRKVLDLPGSNFTQPLNHGTDATLLEQKMKEIMKMTGIITIDSVKYKTDVDDLELLGELGNGTCGHVVKMLHRPSQKVIAVKQMRRSGNVEESKRIAMDLEVVLMCHDCDYIVHCLGCFVTESEVWICMELMGSCFDKLIKRLVSHVPEPILGKVTLATVKALHYLKESHGVMHRDVKPSNILIDERGNVKLCDFGISGRLVDSKAKSMNAGCAAYMSPERINPADPKKPDYDIRADVWSLGITLVELATGVFPYPDCKSDFEVLSRVMQDDPPTLPDNGQFSHQFIHFVSLCLVKDYRLRPKYKKLLEHPFIKRYETERVDVASWYSCAIASRHAQATRSFSKEAKCFCGFVHDSSSRDRIRHSHKNTTGQEWEKLKGVWNTILRSPLFNRRKKSADKELGRQSSDQQAEPEVDSRPPVSPLVLQRLLHQQIQHFNAVRPFRSLSQSPKYSDERPGSVFEYDNVWPDNRSTLSRSREVSTSPPRQHMLRTEQARHSARHVRPSTTPSWLVRSKSMNENADNRYQKRTFGVDSRLNQQHRSEETNRSDVKLDRSKNTADDEFYDRLRQFSLATEDRFKLSIDDQHSSEDRLTGVELKSARPGRFGQATEGRRHSTDHQHVRQVNSSWERRPSPPACSSSSSPEPPPRINKMISPLLARRIAYNNSLIRDNLVPRHHLTSTPTDPRRYNAGQYPAAAEQSGPVIVRSSSLPCTPVLPTRMHSNYRLDNFTYDQDYSP